MIRWNFEFRMAKVRDEDREIVSGKKIHISTLYAVVCSKSTVKCQKKIKSFTMSLYTYKCICIVF